MQDLITVRICTPTSVIWEGPASAVSSINASGPFDILPYHANFITIVEKSPIKVKTGSITKEFTYENAIIHAYKNSVKIFTNLT
jgi:F0F1-type ATP synthase epsilon subunit